jgi:preprotein translocase subunit SecE
MGSPVPSRKDRAADPCHKAGDFIFQARPEVAKTSPAEFVKQVQTETKKIVWPSRRETIMTGIMVLILTTFLGVFFLGIDSIFDLIVNSLLRLAQ